MSVGVARTGAAGWAAHTGLLLLGLAVLGLSIALAVSIGEMQISLPATLKAISNGLLGSGYDVSPIQQGVIWDYRLSRALMAALCGGALAVCGAVLQALLRNPLAEPYILGISAGASTGAVLVLIAGFGAGLLSLSGGALLGAAVAFGAVAMLANGACSALAAVVTM